MKNKQRKIWHFSCKSSSMMSKKVWVHQGIVNLSQCKSQEAHIMESHKPLHFLLQVIILLMLKNYHCFNICFHIFNVCLFLFGTLAHPYSMEAKSSQNIFGRYLGPVLFIFQTGSSVETVRLRRSFWVP